MSPRAEFLIFVVSVGLILFLIFYYLVGINYSYMIRYPILIATIILFVVLMMMLLVVKSGRTRAPLPRASPYSSFTSTVAEAPESKQKKMDFE